MKLILKLSITVAAFVASVSTLLAAAPSITSATADAGNTTLTIVGTNLTQQDAKHPILVTLNNLKLMVTSSSGTGITASLPAGVGAGSYHLYVSTSGNVNDSGHTAALDVTLVSPPSSGGGSSPVIPVISMVWSTSVTPISHPADGQIGCNNSDPTGCTQIWSSPSGTDHIDYSSLFNTFSFDTGGYLVIRNVSTGNGTPQNILVFPLSRFGYSFNFGNANQTMACSPATIYQGAFFSEGDQVMVSFLPPPVPPN